MAVEGVEGEEEGVEAEGVEEVEVAGVELVEGAEVKAGWSRGGGRREWMWRSREWRECTGREWRECTGRKWRKVVGFEATVAIVEMNVMEVGRSRREWSRVEGAEGRGVK